MSVRLLLYETKDIRGLIRDFWRAEQDDPHLLCNHSRMEDLVNRIGEVYEEALSRDGRYVDEETRRRKRHVRIQA